MTQVQRFSQAAQLNRDGELVESSSQFHQLTDQNPQDYNCIVNLGTTLIQLGDIAKANQTIERAILLDPFGYVAYYNRFICQFALGKLFEAWSDLEKALSCLYMFRGEREHNLKFLNKAIKYCEGNPMAYLHRAKIQKLKGKDNLAENDYQTAVQYGKGLADVYQKRALFYRSINRIQEFEDNFKLYLKAKRSKEAFRLPNGEKPLEEDLDRLIREGVIEFHGLLNFLSQDELKQSQELESHKKISHEAQPLKTQEKELNLQKQQDPSTPIEQALVEQIKDPAAAQSKDSSPQKQSQAKEQATPKIQRLSFNQPQTIQEQELLLSSDRHSTEEEVILHLKGSEKERPTEIEAKFNKNFEDIFKEDDDSLNHQIEKVERQIQAQGGKLSLKDQMDLSNSYSANFVSEEIEKAIEELEQMKDSQTIDHRSSDRRSITSSGSTGFKLSQIRQLSMEEFSQHARFTTEIMRLEIFGGKSKEPAYVIAAYNGQTWRSKDSNFEWKEKFTKTINHSQTEIQIKVFLKGGIWKSNVPVGEGSINLLQTGNTKCVISLQNKKTGIIYYKLKHQ